MIETTNYQLKKIELTDSPPDITVLSDNWDFIDAALRDIANHMEDANYHMQDDSAHVTASERSAWNSKAAGSHNHDTAYAPKSHSDNSTIHITASERSAWNSKAAGSHNHSASNITSGTLPVSRGGTGVTSTFTNFTFTKSHSSFGSHWGQIFCVDYLGMAYLNIAISVNATVNAGTVKIGSVNSSYKPQTRTQLAASLSRGHAFINTDGSITLYSDINFSSGTPVYISGWYRVAS